MTKRDRSAIITDLAIVFFLSAAKLAVLLSMGVK